MIAISYFLLSIGAIDFYVDPVIYRSSIEITDTITHLSHTEVIYYIEFNCEIPYQKLFYEETDSIIFSRTTIPFKLSNLLTRDSLVDTLYRQFTIPSFSEAAQQQMSYIIQFGMYVPEGEFKYSIEILSGAKKGIKEGRVEIKKEDYTISDILVASEIALDTLGIFLRKGNLRVTPHPSKIFNERFDKMYLYYELYDITPDSTHLDIIYTVKDTIGKVVRQMSRRVAKKYESQAINLGFDIHNFDPGLYYLGILITDEKARTIAQKEVMFEITKAIQKEVTFEGMPHYDEIEYFLTPDQYKFFKGLPDEGKIDYLKRFWRVYDYYEIAERFDYANEYYKQGRKSGSKTDRGRIYIKFGKPDDVDKGKPIDYREWKPYEHWQYYNGLEFIFVDIHGTNEYTLVWTNAETEQSQPTLYKYLPDSKVELVQ